MSFTPAAIAAGQPAQPETLAEMDLAKRLELQRIERERQAEIVEQGRREGEVLEALMRGGTHVTAPDGTVTFLGTPEEKALLEHPAPGTAEAAAAERRRVLAENRLRVETAEEQRQRQLAEAEYVPLPEWLIEHVVRLTAEWATIVARGSWVDGRWVPDPEDEEAGTDLVLGSSPGWQVAINMSGRVLRLDTPGLEGHLPEMLRAVVGTPSRRSDLEKARYCPEHPGLPLRWVD